VDVAIHCAHGRLGHRPVRRVSDCEVLAALVPERVLPFASGGSRKRGLSRAEVKKPRMPRWGAERRARPLHFLRSKASPGPRSSRSGKTGERARAASFDAARWCASRRSASLLLREEFLATLFGLAFLGVAKLGCEGASRQPKSLSPPGLTRWSMELRRSTHRSQLHSAVQHGPPGQARW
jgi:hypothetical protein